MVYMPKKNVNSSLFTCLLWQTYHKRIHFACVEKQLTIGYIEYVFCLFVFLQVNKRKMSNRTEGTDDMEVRRFEWVILVIPYI